MRSFLPVSVFLLIFLCLTGTAMSSTFVVTRNDDRDLATCTVGDCSLREAIKAANAAASDDVILFAAGATNIILTEEIEITGNGSLTINGTGPASLLIDGGTGENGIFFLNQANVMIANLSLTGGFGGKFYTGGGAIMVNHGTLVLDRIHAFGNSTFGAGGVVYYLQGVNHRILNSTFNTNTATNCGVFYNDRGTLSIVNSTFTGNIASSVGGAFCTDGTTKVRNITVTGNTAELGGGLQFGLGEFSFGNSIIAGNTATKDYQEMLIDASGVIFAGNNLIGDSAGDAQNTNVPITYPPSDILNTPPMLAPLAKNGGPTPTRMPLSASPLINAGNNNRAFDPHDNSPLLTDQRGATRIAEGTVDIGAVETGASLVSPAALYDFDGDRKTDFSIFRPASGEWWINRSSTNITTAAQFGTTTDKIAAADYTGDGKTDIAIWRPSTGEWYVLRSEDLSFFSVPFGTASDIPVPADYDADRRSDIAVFRPSTSTWFIHRSGDGGTTILQFGVSGDVPVVGDYDGDGKADVAIYRPSNGQWWLSRSAAGIFVAEFGGEKDKQVQGDYTGDGKTDIAFWRPSSGEWYILRSEDSSYYSVPFGLDTDIPAPGDYDGDGRFDTTVFRESNSTWYSQRSTAGPVIRQFGSTGDRPVPSALVR